MKESVATSLAGGEQEEMERFGTVSTWANFLSVDQSTVRGRLEGVMGISGRDSQGRAYNNGFYPEFLIRRLCSDLLHDVNDEGVVIVNDIVGVIVAKYATKNGMTNTALQKAVDEANLPVIGQTRSGRYVVNIYEKERVDSLLHTAKQIAERKLDENGEVCINNIPCIGVVKYAGKLGVSYSGLQSAINNAGLTAVDKAKSGTVTVDVYEKAKVAALPHCMCLDEKGEIIVYGTTCTGIDKYAKINGMVPASLLKAVVDADIRVRGRVRSRNQCVDVYEKKMIEELSYVQDIKECRGYVLDSNGEVMIGQILVIGVSRYARRNGISHVSLQRAIDNAGLPVIGKVKSGSHTVNAYEKVAVEALPFFLCLNESGEASIGDCIVIGNSAYAKSNGMSPEGLQGAIDKASLPVVGKIRSGNQLVDAYEKTEVDSLAYVQARLPQ